MDYYFFILMNYPSYKLHFLSVGDADSMVISYQTSILSSRQIVLIDAGNVSDAGTIKKFLLDNYKTLKIDLAICTHPDKDHKGGFFELLEDDDIEIVDFWYNDPSMYVCADDLKDKLTEGECIKYCRRVFNHPDDSKKNLIEIAKIKCTGIVRGVRDGDKFTSIPLSIVGPSTSFLREAAKEMVENFVELKDEPDMERYEEKALPNDDESKSVIDEDDDLSATNKNSLIVLFAPNRKFLLLGDATCASIRDAMEHHDLSQCVIKVPHHGSKHNLTTEIIENLNIVQSVISAQGSKKHPNSAIVHWLSKYGNVYSTHKSKDLYYTSEPVLEGAKPLREKQKNN